MTCCPHLSATPATCPACEFEPFVRNHFFTGKMMGARDFIAESSFHAEKLRHHHARLHGWGVVCGLRVAEHPTGSCLTRYVIVEPGAAIDCCGHEILVAQREVLDVAGFPQVRRLAAGPLAPLHTLQVCARFKECPTEDVPVLYDDCGCDDTQCAPNRILESFELDVLVDPPLTVTKRRAADLVGVIAVNTDPGLTGFLPIAGRDFVYAVAGAAAEYLLQIDLRQYRQTRIPLGGRAVALVPSHDGAHVFVVTAPTAGAVHERNVRIFLTSDGTPVDAASARLVPGTVAAGVIGAGASSAAARRLLTYDRASGELRAWAADVANVLAARPAAPTPVGPGLSALVVEPDGSHAYAVDEANARVRVIDFAAANPVSDLAGLPATARPSALAFFMSGATRMLAVASRAERRVYLVPLAANPVATTLEMERDPIALFAPPGDFLYVWEEDAGTGYLQAVDLEPLRRNATPLVSAARAAGPVPAATPKGIRLIAIGRDAEPALIDTAELAFADCGDIIWSHLAGCPACDTPNCVVLATLTHYRPGAEMLERDPAVRAADDIVNGRSRIDNRLGRRVLASTQLLQAWLECLQDHGGTVGPQGPTGPTGPQGDPGPDGPPGVGLNPNLPKIIDIAWTHGEMRHVITELLDLLLAPGQPRRMRNPDEIRAIVRGIPPLRLPPFTIYFNRRMTGVDRQTLRVSVDGPGVYPLGGQLQFTGLYSVLRHEFYGDIVDIDAPPGGALITPHTAEQSPFAVSFVPRLEAFTDPVALLLLLAAFAAGQRFDLVRPVVTITLKGDFVFAPGLNNAYSQDAVLDGNNVGGRVGRNEVRGGIIRGGRNPSGNLTQGGLFESWFFLTLQDDVNLAPLARLNMTLLAGGPAAAGAPVVARLATEDQLAAVPGISRAMARRIVAERERAPFAGVTDFRTRLRLTDRQFEPLRDHLIIF